MYNKLRARDIIRNNFLPTWTSVCASMYMCVCVCGVYARVCVKVYGSYIALFFWKRTRVIQTCLTVTTLNYRRQTKLLDRKNFCGQFIAPVRIPASSPYNIKVIIIAQKKKRFGITMWSRSRPPTNCMLLFYR